MYRQAAWRRCFQGTAHAHAGLRVEPITLVNNDGELNKKMCLARAVLTCRCRDVLQLLQIVRDQVAAAHGKILVHGSNTFYYV